MKYYTVALYIAAALLAQESSAFSVGSSMSSAFGGSVLITGKDSVATAGNGASIEMKKGKDNVPPAMRSQYKRQREMSTMREQMMDAQKPGPDGLPVFNLYVRSPRANVSQVKSTQFAYMPLKMKSIIFMRI
jgi:hypothetical protein